MRAKRYYGTHRTGEWVPRVLSASSVEDSGLGAMEVSPHAEPSLSPLPRGEVVLWVRMPPGEGGTGPNPLPKGCP